MRRLHLSRVATEVARRPALLLVTITALALALAAAWLVTSRDMLGLFERPDPSVSVVASSQSSGPIARDVASEPWRIVAPKPQGAPPPARVEPAPDWTAFSLPVADPNTVAPATVALASAPSGLDVPMSSRERKALIATAREPEGLPSPEGYRPGIAVIVPGGSMSDGVCR